MENTVCDMVCRKFCQAVLWVILMVGIWPIPTFRTVIVPDRPQLNKKVPFLYILYTKKFLFCVYYMLYIAYIFNIFVCDVWNILFFFYYVNEIFLCIYFKFCIWWTVVFSGEWLDCSNHTGFQFSIFLLAHPPSTKVQKLFSSPPKMHKWNDFSAKKIVWISRYFGKIPQKNWRNGWQWDIQSKIICTCLPMDCHNSIDTRFPVNFQQINHISKCGVCT